MKKVYEKPEIVFESFSLSTSIAGDCKSIVGTQAAGNCAILGDSGYIVFTSITGCNADGALAYPDQGENDMFCYHVPTPTTALFNS